MDNSLSNSETGNVWKAAVEECDAQMSHDDFWRLYRGLLDGCGRKPPTIDQGRVWFLALSDLTADDFARAIGAFLRQHSQEFLSVARIRELSGVQSSTEDAAELAWHDVLDAIRKHGAYPTVEFEDPVSAETVRALGGWVALCDKQSNELRTWISKDFRRLYKVISGRGVVSTGRLVGIIETTNHCNGHDTDDTPVVRIGSATQRPRLRNGNSIRLPDLSAERMT